MKLYLEDTVTGTKWYLLAFIVSRSTAAYTSIQEAGYSSVTLCTLYLITSLRCVRCQYGILIT
jgi:hypothetical protein